MRACAPLPAQGGEEGSYFKFVDTSVQLTLLEFAGQRYSLPPLITQSWLLVLSNATDDGPGNAALGNVHAGSAAARVRVREIRNHILIGIVSSPSEFAASIAPG
jgi:hypothetical protein